MMQKQLEITERDRSGKALPFFHCVLWLSSGQYWIRAHAIGAICCHYSREYKQFRQTGIFFILIKCKQTAASCLSCNVTIFNL